MPDQLLMARTVHVKLNLTVIPMRHFQSFICHVAQNMGHFISNSKKIAVLIVSYSTWGLHKATGCMSLHTVQQLRLPLLLVPLFGQVSIALP